MRRHDRFLSRDAWNYRPSAIRALARYINDPNVISFAGGVPSPETFPADLIAELAQKVVRERRAVTLQYGPTRGLPRLCEAVSSICRERGIAMGADEILITTGSQQALDLVSHTLLDPGDVVLVELPTYIGATASFYARSAELAGVAQDDDGIVPEALDRVATILRSAGRRVKLLYTIPNFQNPSGRLMTQQRRQEVREIAERHDILIIEDDPYGELVYVDDADTTPIKARGQNEGVIYLGSFSKVLAPGLRCGWIAAPRAIAERLEIAKQAADLCSGMLDQSIVDEFLASGLLRGQIETVRAFYRRKRQTLLDALRENLGERARWTPAEGGLFTFVTFPDGIDAAERLPQAVARGVAYVPGAPFFVDGSGANTLRLTFAKETDERMREGVGRLANVFA
jgi:DNA-binding transcriptional MocR family regulator